MNLITTLESKRVENYKKNYSILFEVEKYYIEKNFDWIKIEIKDKLENLLWPILFLVKHFNLFMQEKLLSADAVVEGMVNIKRSNLWNWVKLEHKSVFIKKSNKLLHLFLFLNSLSLKITLSSNFKQGKSKKEEYVNSKFLSLSVSSFFQVSTTKILFTITGFFKTWVPVKITGKKERGREDTRNAGMGKEK